MDFYNISINMHHGADRRMPVHVCSFMYKQMYTYIFISYNIWKRIGNNVQHIMYNTYLATSGGAVAQRIFAVRLCTGLHSAVWFELPDTHNLTASLGYLLQNDTNTRRTAA